MLQSPQRDRKPVRSEFLVFGSPSIAEAEVEEVVAALGRAGLARDQRWQDSNQTLLPTRGYRVRT